MGERQCNVNPPVTLFNSSFVDSFFFGWGNYPNVTVLFYFLTLKQGTFVTAYRRYGEIGRAHV